MSAIEQIEIEQLKEQLKDASESISWWNRRYNALNKCNNEKKDRINKAIEYIENNGMLDLNGYDLLDILRGKDNENR